MGKGSDLKFGLYLGLVVAICITLIVFTGHKKFTDQEERTFMKDYLAVATKPGKPVDVEAKLREGIKHLSKKEDASTTIDALLYSMYQMMPTMNEKATGLYQQISDLESQKIDVNDSKNYSKVADETLLAFLKEAHRNHLLVAKEDNQYVMHPDMDYILNSYQQYMSDSMLSYVKFSQMEYNEPFFDETKKTFDLDLVVNRILYLEDAVKKYKDTYYEKAFSDSKDYYYQVYFGMNNSFLVDSNKKVLPDVLAHYKKTIQNHNNTQLAKDLLGYLDVLQKTNDVVDANALAYLADLTSQSESTSDQNPNELSGSEQKNDVDSVLDDAIKDNAKS